MEPVIPRNEGPYAAMLDELAAAEASYRAATERRRRLVAHVLSLPESERPSPAKIAKAMGLTRPGVNRLATSRTVY